MRTSEQIQAEIQQNFGFVPPFFEPAFQNPQVLENLWQQTLYAYILNPFSSLFKEKLSAYLSRYCWVPYCLVCHSCSLRPLGMSGQEVLQLLSSPAPSPTEIGFHLSVLRAGKSELNVSSNLNPVLEESLLRCAIFISKERYVAENCRRQLRDILGDEHYQHLVTFVAYVRTCHAWMEAHPEVSYQADKRAIDYLATLLSEAPALADFFHNYVERVNGERLTKRPRLPEYTKQQEIPNQVIADNLLLAQAVNSASVGVLITDPQLPDHPIIYSNPAFSRLTGYQPDEIIGRNCRFLQGENTNSQTIELLRKGIAEAREVKATLLNYRKDGKPFWNELKISPVFSDKGKLLYFIGFQTDVTEKKQLETNLELQVWERTAQLQKVLEFEATLKRITDKMRDSLDENQILQTVVQELALVLPIDGCSIGLYNASHTTSTISYEFIRRVPSALGSAVQMADFSESYRQLLQNQHFQFCELVPSLRGEVAILACPIFDDRGVIGDLWLFKQREDAFNSLEVRLVQQVANQCAIALRSVRLSQAAQAQVVELEKLKRLKDDFLSTISHELRTPVSNMNMAIQMLEIPRKQPSNPDSSTACYNQEDSKASRYWQILKEECDREMSLINALLDLQQLEAGNQPIELTVVHLQDWIPHVVEQFEDRFQQQELRLQLEICPDLPAINCDVYILGRILAELLDNACKHTPPSEEITLKVQSRSGMIQLSVSNSGVEIPEGELPHVFDKFYRVPSTDPWKQGGTGLGLALVKKLTEYLGGRISVTSRSGQTCFTVELPINT